MSKIFISYCRQSETMARSLVTDLESLGHDVWFDRELSGGQAWWDQILAMVRDCAVFVFLLDPKALNSTACQREFSYADDLGKPILPVLVADGVSTNLLPPELSRIQFIDYRKQDRNTAFGLARALAGVPPSKPLPDPLPPPPEVPISYLGNLARKVDTASTLSFEEQSALVVDLRTSLRDPEAADDTRTLLKRLRNRRDLFASIAAEIDDVLALPRQAPSPWDRTGADRQRQASPVPEVASLTEPLPKQVTFRERLLGAVLGAAVAVAIVAPLYYSDPDRWLASAVFCGTAGGITGAITGTHGRVIVIALAGLILGFSVWAMSGDKAVGLGAIIGAIFGAIVGAMMRKKKGWT